MGGVCSMHEMRNAYNLWLESMKGRILLRRLEYNVKMDLKEISLGWSTGLM
jgi:hypothetical protein